MNFSVPQFIEVKDKIAFGLNGWQLGIFGLGGVALFVAWNVLPQSTFFIWAILASGICAGFAFIRPNGTSLANFLLRGFYFMVKPRVLVWKRGGRVLPKKEKAEVQKKDPARINRFAKEEKLKNIQEMAKLLDEKSDI